MPPGGQGRPPLRSDNFLNLRRGRCPHRPMRGGFPKRETLRQIRWLAGSNSLRTSVKTVCSARGDVGIAPYEPSRKRFEHAPIDNVTGERFSFRARRAGEGVRAVRRARPTRHWAKRSGGVRSVLLITCLAGKQCRAAPDPRGIRETRRRRSRCG